jgi:hypothetical protein
MTAIGLTAPYRTAKIVARPASIFARAADALGSLIEGRARRAAPNLRQRATARDGHHYRDRGHPPERPHNNTRSSRGKKRARREPSIQLQDRKFAVRQTLQELFGLLMLTAVLVLLGAIDVMIWVRPFVH